MFKRDVFDLPLIQLMRKYENGKASAADVQNFIDDFNKKTNGYADFSFDANKKKLAYTDNKVKYDLSKYANPGTAKQELIDNIKLTMSDKFQKSWKKSLPVDSNYASKDQLKKFKSKEAKDLLKMIKLVGCPNAKAGGGRIEFAEGGDCFDKGQKLINNGMKGATPGALKNLAKLGPALLRAGSAVMSGLILPEAVIVGLETAARVGYGDTASEAILRATDYITPDSFFGNFMQKADLMKIERILGNDVKNIAAQSFDHTNQLDKIQKLKDKKEHLETWTEADDGFSYFGDDSDQIKKTSDQLEQAKKDLKSKFTVPGQEARNYFTQSKFDDAYDASKANSPWAAATLKDSQSLNPRIRAASEMKDRRSQKQLNKNISLRSPLTGSEEETAFLSLSQLPKGPRLPSDMDILRDLTNKRFKKEGINKKVTSQDLKLSQDEKQMWKDMSIEQMIDAGIPLEAILGFNQAEPINRIGPGYYSNYKPLNRFGSQQRPVLYPKDRGSLAEGGITALRSKYEYKK